MESQTLNGHKIETYSDIEELPIDRYSKFNKYMLLNDKVGSSFGDADKHFSKLYMLINDPVKLKAQIDLFRQFVFLLDNEQSMESLAYVCLVKSINGEPKNDLTVDGLYDTLSLIKDIKSGQLKKKYTVSQSMRMILLQPLIQIFSVKQNWFTSTILGLKHF